MFCPKCGSRIAEGNVACGQCGTRVVEATSQGGVPSGYGAQAAYVPDYLVWSILELCFCCMPLGIAGLIYSIQANSAKAAGRFDEAMQQAKTAKKCLLWGIGLWAVAIVLYIAFIIVVVVAGVVTQQ